MKKLIAWLFPKWEILWTHRAQWNTDTRKISGIHVKTTEYCYYEIFFSEPRQELKLVCSGDSPKEHTFYQVAVDKLNAYRDVLGEAQNKEENGE